MTARNPITAHTAPGVIVLVIDVDTAVAIADSVEFGVASGGLSTIGRPLGYDDVELVRTAAAQAAADADPDTPVLLVGVSAPRALRLVERSGDRC